MWISEKLQEQKESARIAESVAVSGGEKLTLSGGRALVSPPVVHPYGVYAPIPQGERVITADDRVMGVAGVPSVTLEEGEVCLYSKGGSLILKNNGDVLVNGRKLTF